MKNFLLPGKTHNRTVTDEMLTTNSRETLKSVRLTSKQLARMGNIKKKLFDEITLWNTENNLRRLDATDFSEIGSSVSRVCFCPRIYTSTLTFSAFEQIILAQEAYSGQARWSTKKGAYERKRWLRSRAPGTKALKAAYDHYIQCAHSVESSTHIEKLHHVWTSTLTNFHNASFFNFGRSLDFLRNNCFHQQDLIISAPGKIKSIPNYEDGYCFRNPAPHRLLQKALSVCEEGLFRTGVECIIKAGLRIRTLQLDCVQLPDRNKMNSSSIQVQDALEQVEKYVSDSRSYFGIYWGLMDFGAQMVDLSDTTTSNMLQNCHHNLQHFVFERHIRMNIWRNVPSHLDFPALRTLHLKSVRLLAKDLIMLLRSPNLESLGMQGCLIFNYDDLGSGPDSNVYQGYKTLFDAIRGLRNAIHMHFDVRARTWVIVNGKVIWNMKNTLMDFTTNDESSFSHLQSHELEHELERSLGLYLISACAWNDILEKSFPQS